MITNLAGQSFGTQMTALDGSPFTGAVTMRLVGDNGAPFVGTVGGGACTPEGLGLFTYTGSAADTNFTKHLAAIFSGIGAITRTVQYGFPYTMLRSLGGQIIGCQMTTKADGSDYTGPVTVTVTGDNGIETLGSVGGGACVLKINGYYSYVTGLPDTTFKTIAFTFAGPGAITQTIVIDTITADQASAFLNATGTGVVAVSEIVGDAFREINVFGTAQPQDPADMAFGCGKLNRILDGWNAARDYIYQMQFLSYALVPGLSPHLIGPSGTWNTLVRPVSIDGATLDIGNGVQQLIDVDHDWAWYLAISQKGLSTAYPTDAYYEPDWPNGKLFFWPVPTGALIVTLAVRLALAQVRLTDTFWMPPGYRDAVTMTLAEALTIPYPRKGRDDGKVGRAALLARERAFSNNLTIPSLATRDSGMPRGGRRPMNYLTRQYNP